MFTYMDVLRPSSSTLNPWAVKGSAMQRLDRQTVTVDDDGGGMRGALCCPFDQKSPYRDGVVALQGEHKPGLRKLSR